jgi:hypothetical protein
MSRGGSIKVQLQEARDAIDDEAMRWQEQNLPSPKRIWRMNDDEFMHHIHLEAVTELIKDKLDVSDDEVELYLSRAFLQGMKAMYADVLAARSDAVRDQIINGVNIVPPPEL